MLFFVELVSLASPPSIVCLSDAASSSSSTPIETSSPASSSSYSYSFWPFSLLVDWLMSLYAYPLTFLTVTVLLGVSLYALKFKLPFAASLASSKSGVGGAASSSPQRTRLASTHRTRRASALASEGRGEETEDTDGGDAIVTPVEIRAMTQGKKKASNNNDSDSQVADDEEEMTATEPESNSVHGTPSARSAAAAAARHHNNNGGVTTAAAAAAATAPSSSGLTRRQKKNRKHVGQELGQDGGGGNGSSRSKKESSLAPLQIYASLGGMSDEAIYWELHQRYVYQGEQLREQGFPMESTLEQGKSYIMHPQQNQPASPRPSKVRSKAREDMSAGDFDEQLNPNATVFTPRSSSTVSLDKVASSSPVPIDEDRLPKAASATSVSTTATRQLSPNAEEFVPKRLNLAETGDVPTPPMSPRSKRQGSELQVASSQGKHDSEDDDEKECMRCGKLFYISGCVYVTTEKCYYHFGRVKQQRYDCCGGRVKESKGCSVAGLHVWKGLHHSNRIDYFTGFVTTKPPKRRGASNSHGVYALDAEMAFTVEGLELVNVTVVGLDGRKVYEAYVVPENDIVDFNTRFSGITQRDLERNPTKTLREVQNDLMGFVNANTILVGHSLENDLRVLKLVHMTVIDTALLFSSRDPQNGQLIRPSLKVLAKSYLGKDIQSSEAGHQSLEDATASMELVLAKLINDARNLM